jgi:hypothetical protein
MTKILKKVQLSTEQSISKSADPTKGTQTNPFTQVEMATLQEEGIWNGGYVERMGYVPSNANYGGMSDSGYYIYIYSTFVPIDYVYHHEFDKTELTDIHVTANIKVYKMTINVIITNKDINNVSNIRFYREISNGSVIDEDSWIDSDGKYHYQLILELPKIIPPTIKLTINCNYLHDNYLYDITKEIPILSPYDCYS